MCKEYKKICVTNRKLVQGDFLTQMEKVLASGPDLVILREKDLDQDAYRGLAEQLLPLCRKAGVPCWFNGQAELAREMKADGLQISFEALLTGTGLTREETLGGQTPLGVSVHSLEEAKEAERLGADTLIYGHIFTTDCKPGVAPRGLAALRAVTSGVNIPVFAIGGIDEENASQCVEAGAAGVCMMSGYMRR